MSHSLWARLTRRPSRHCTANFQAAHGRNNKSQLIVEVLESRDLLSAGFQPSHVLLPHGGGATPFATPGPTGTTPTQIRQAYGFNAISFNNGTIAGDGSGTTIAIVDAYDDPRIANDLHQFDLRFGLPDPVFTKVNQNGGSTMPPANSGWASEIALDVEWAHAIAPGANILLVEASSNSYANLFAAVTYAAKQPNVVAVSMSWGGGEFLGETSYDSVFKTPAGHSGVTFVISSGDAGAPASYPATSPNVLSVGGTTLNVDASGNILSESGWSGSGGGISAYESQPAYQNGVVTQSATRRTSPDVAYDSDPNTGFPVYDSYNNPISAPWSQFGGTSDAAPQWAALIAIADQGRIKAGLGSLDGPSQTLPAIYALPAGDFHDTMSGTSTGSPHFSAGPLYDLVTGRGTPFADRIVADLVGQTPSAPGATHFSLSTSNGSSVAGNAFSITVTALDSGGNVVPGYVGTVHFSSSDTAAVLPPNYTFSAGDAGSHAFNITLKKAGSDTVTLTDTSSAGVAGTLAETVTPAAASQLRFGQQPSNTLAGSVIAPAVTVAVYDAYGNLVNSDNSDQVTIAIGANPAGGTLSGTTTATVSNGIASFNNLAIDNAGNGYTLLAQASGLTGAASVSFSITATGGGGSGGGSGTVIESFEASESWYLVGGWRPTAVLATYAAHDGRYGLDDYAGNDWIYRSDAGAQLRTGDTASVWLEFSGSADGRAYFGFGASSHGTLSLVAAPNTGQLILQANPNFGFTDLAAVGQSYLPNHWYRLEVDWGASGAIIGKLFDSDGTTLLNQVAGSTTSITSGGIAFRATGSDKFFDTVTASYGVNTFARQAGTPLGHGPAIDGGFLTNPWFAGVSAWLAQEHTPTIPTASATPQAWTPSFTPPRGHANPFDPFGEWGSFW